MASMVTAGYGGEEKSSDNRVGYLIAANVEGGPDHALGTAISFALPRSL
jgi:hypothetical protein